MTVNLSKGQGISLSKPNGSGLTKVRMGVGWDIAKPKGFFSRLLSSDQIDLDASCVLFDASKEPVDAVYFGKLQSDCKSILHTGDNRTGEGDGDDESIIVDLTSIPGNVSHLVFTVSSFQGQTFETVENAYCRLVDSTNQDEELARYSLSQSGPHTSIILTVLSREGDGWTMKADGTTCQGRTIKDILPYCVLAI